MGFDFLREPELPAPRVGEAQATRLLATHYGIEARLESLGSNQDENFLVIAAGDRTVGVLKIANPAFTAVELAAQDAAAEAIAHAEPSLRVAVPQRNLDGEVATEVTGLLDGTAHVRLLPFLSGGTLVDMGYLAPAVVAGMGDLAARVSCALADFRHPGLDRALQWDLRFGHDVVQMLASHVADPTLRERLCTAAADAWARIAPVAHQLPRQAVHLDLTDANVVAGAARRPDGIIDFGDLSDTWAVSELAITLSSVLGHCGAAPTSILPGVKAFHATRPLSGAEVDALWPLLVLRTAVLIVSGAQQVSLDPDNAYLTDQSHAESRMFEQATSVPMDVMTAVVRAELGLAEPPAALTGSLIPELDVASVHELDLSTTSELFDKAPEGVLGEHFRNGVAVAAIEAGATLVVTRFGEADLTRAPLLSQDSPAVVATGVSMWPAAPLTLVAPWPGEIVRRDGEFNLRGTEFELTLTGAEPTPADTVTTGEPLATVGAGGWTHVAVRPVGAPVAPAYVTAELAPGWLALSRDPSPLLGLPESSSETTSNLLARRDESFARVQEHYYADPPQIERGRRHYLMSTAGRAYLDMVNNVTMLGHAHPRVADTANRQLRRLNTNSRFNYEAVVEFSERLAAMLPDPLDTVFLVNSGSEASDLALRLALAVSGHRDVIAVGEAYHGWTYATDAVSTSTADNPQALTTRPDWIHAVESPNSFRGTHRGADAARYATDAVATVADLVAAGRPPAGFICESVYGNAGGMALPDGYLRQVYAAVRAAGGYAIADEVQVGYGRLGEWFWGFEQQGVVPDIVSIAKSTGNGYPLGAVITSRAIADAFSSQGYFFSSTGGSPLSCAIGLTVLDVLREEDLQGNAKRVGGHLKAELTALAAKHPIIGTVHGMGLYLGVEMVRDRDTLEPATEETAAICDRMLELGVVIQPTGERQNILKTKPPLCLDVAGADFYVAALDRVLTEGW
ncbi:4-aminobutyrate aminotransferase [Mycolicibacterium madagascariense]|uniref:4-aminobutyrate aminotransferase n=1 Tax=Mycolicibacterium madagascariense TaxID=212765 RepID=A0A7I7XL68_9MYCO|nr:aminotransferase [Mycolicibacterium madagascariense]MCV7013220.1 aminotransferase [Mycolicibacterium madagascariense]BBZ29960.1 4-aminobutyrate aminotransferase [Mycolicibacterium madagascariense]